MLKRFMQDAQGMHGTEINGDWEWLFLAQHHGVPTRLLDWSENALMALYFACEPGLEGPDPDRSDGDVWVLLPNTFNETVGSWRGRHRNDLPMLGVDRFLDKYHPLTPPPADQEMLHPVAALAGRTFSRITNQRGTFTISIDDTPLDLRADALSYLFRLTVAGPNMHGMIDELRYLGVESHIVYPDLHRLGARTKALFQ
jgi:hypothetical protein